MFARTTATAFALVLASASAAGAQANEPAVIDNGVGDAVVVPLNSSIASVEPGDTKWVALNWTSLEAEARNLKVTAAGTDGVSVEYPQFSLSEDPTAHTNNGYSSGYADSTLSESEVDYTALKLSVDADVTGSMALVVTVSYDSDSGSHINQHKISIGETLPACDVMVIESFQQAPWTFTFQVRNTTSSALDYQFVIPDANYQLDNLVLNGSSQGATLDQFDNGDGTWTITVSGELPAWQSIGGQQPGAFNGEFTPTSGDPFVRCG